jgi:hypothetical protein
MAETALLQHVVAFAGALWWTKQWLVNRPPARWRFAVSGLAGALLWVLVAYVSTNAQAASSGVVVSFNSLPIAYFAAFMAVTSLVGTVLGLLLWTEEEIKETGQGVPTNLKSNIRDGD